MSKKWGKLTPLSFHETSKHKHHFWLCKCDCGNQFIARCDSLCAGAQTSCGCVRKGKGKESSAWKGYENVSGSTWGKILHGAKCRNLQISITIQDVNKLWIDQKGICALSGLSLTLPSGKINSKTTASLDRVDSSKGYILGNIQWTHKLINEMKMDLSQEKFIELCQAVVNFNALVAQQ